MTNTIKQTQIKTVTLFEQENMRHTPSWEDQYDYSLTRGYDDGYKVWDHGHEYMLPDGYTLGKTLDDVTHIFDKTDMACVIVAKGRNPWLVSADGEVKLSKV